MFSRFATRAVAGAGAAGVAGIVGAAIAEEEALHPMHLDWDHKGPLSSFDHASIRRGFQVYREVCASCHSLDRIYWRNLVNVIMDEKEAKAMAAEEDVQDGPNDEGEMFDRPGKLSDALPRPYPNDEAAKAANGGALPPDLSLICKARHGGEDYIFSLLANYRDAPAGIELREGLHYNPYFPGGAISMEKQLNDGQVEYPDGTPATVSQMAKDVSTFLAWAAEPEHDDRKKMGVQWVIGLVIMAGFVGYAKRFRWGPIKARKIEYADAGH